MKITPLEISNQEFPKRFNGYDVKEVREFLSVVREEYEALTREKRQLEDENSHLKRELETHRDKEDLLKDTLKTAQQMSQGMQATAQKEVEAIMSEARVHAQELVNASHLRAMEMIELIKELKRQKISFESSLKALIESHAKMVEAISDDPMLKEVDNKVDFLAKRLDKMAG